MRRKIRYHGHTFFRNQDGYYRNGQTTLHRFKYEEKFGTVFSCFHLHHKDGNKFNNNINNLMLLSVQEHIAMYKAMRRKKMFKDQLVLDFRVTHSFNVFPALNFTVLEAATSTFPP